MPLMCGRNFSRRSNLSKTSLDQSLSWSHMGHTHPYPWVWRKPADNTQMPKPWLIYTVKTSWLWGLSLSHHPCLTMSNKIRGLTADVVCATTFLWDTRSSRCCFTQRDTKSWSNSAGQGCRAWIGEISGWDPCSICRSLKKFDSSYYHHQTQMFMLIRCFLRCADICKVGAIETRWW